MKNFSVEFHFNEQEITFRIDNVIAVDDDAAFPLARQKLQETMGIDVEAIAVALNTRYWMETPHEEEEE